MSMTPFPNASALVGSGTLPTPSTVGYFLQYDQTPASSLLGRLPGNGAGPLDYIALGLGLTLTNGTLDVVSAGSDSQIIFNNHGALAGAEFFTYLANARQIRQLFDAVNGDDSQQVWASDDGGRSSMTQWERSYQELALGAEWVGSIGGYVPGSTGAALLYVDGDLEIARLQLYAGMAPSAGQAISPFLSTVLGLDTGGVAFVSDAAGKRLTLTPEFMQMVESTAPAAPETNEARVFARDSGGGKTELCVRFATGAIQVLATEP